MFYTLDNNTAIASILLLLVVSITTIEICRRDRTEKKSTGQFLFEGKTQVHSLASNIGSLFSLTYFFGGAVVYGFLFGLWYLAVSGLILVVLIIVLHRILETMASSVAAKEGDAEGSNNMGSNILLDHLKVYYTTKDFKILLRVYAIIYFSLLVVELAVSRLVLSIIFPSHPATGTLVMSTISLIILAYLYYGGFRAVLNSDLVQMAIVGLFLLCLGFVLAKNFEVAQFSVMKGTHITRSGYLTLVFVFVFGVSWFAAGVDFYSRLNFHGDNRTPILRQRQVFIVISLALTFTVLAVGIAYGIFLRSQLPEISSPVVYTAQTVEHFFNIGRPMIVVCFLGSIFCMVFTTIDTLLLTVLQLGNHLNIGLLRRRNVSRLFMMAIILSCLLEFNSVSVFAIFAGSLMIIPATAVAKSTSRLVSRFVAPGLGSLEWSLVASTLLFIILLRDLKLAFDYHFLIPGFVLLVTFICVTAGNVFSYASSKIHDFRSLGS